ncbi:DUF4389 domain-containing protein [Microbulbifer elongatus]|uniref:DUF4389 domain-containing protein n=1 Tax=Microbulbifer elongatus TaxID=86173 RepID=A0ABT1NZX2_9GAMM|nr:DUF4389 domain-containing protein [Microbulbifer elongatus]MCQ3829398.1 DUF4389 domain-containing protein [Microbulbifer elongatus]
MSNEELKQNLTSTNQWLRLVYMVLFAVLLEIAGFVMLAVVIAQFLFAIFTGGANDNLRRLGDQISSYIYQALQFLIYNTEEKPFPFSEWPESEEEDLSSYESAEEVDGEVIDDVDTLEAELDDVEAEVDDVEAEVDEVQAEVDEVLGESSDDVIEPESASAEEQAAEKPPKRKKPAKTSKASDEEETVIELGADSAEAAASDSEGKASDEKK